MTKISSIAAIIIGLIAPVCVLAAPGYSDKPYEATIENCTSNMNTHSYNDGKGHLRSETMVGGVNRVSIMDFNAKVTYSIDDANKTVMKIPLNFSPEENPNAKWQAIPGVKVIDGHPCSGKKMDSNGAPMEVWTGNDTGCSVLVTANGKPVMKLKSWRPTVPNPFLFTPPAGYKVVDMMEMMKGTPH